VKTSFRKNSLHVVALICLSVSAPVFDLLSRYPTFLIAKKFDFADVYILTGVLTLGVSGLGVLLEVLFRIFTPKLRAVMHHLLIGALFTLMSLRPVKQVLSGYEGTAAVFLGASFVLSYIYFRRIRSCLSLCAASVIILPIIFLMNEDIRTLSDPFANKYAPGTSREAQKTGLPSVFRSLRPNATDDKDARHP